MRRLLMLGLDGATYRVLDPIFKAGHMPALSRLLTNGASGVLESTVPPYTPPGWTSIFTGVNPGRHGIIGFHLGNAQRPGGLVTLDRVASPAIWNAANAQNRRVGLFNVPMTYPAPLIDGFAVSGMLTPDGGGHNPRSFTHPLQLSGDIIERVGPYEIDIPVDYSVDWRGPEILERLSKNLALKKRVLHHLLESHDVSLLFAVLEAPDRLMHVHYKYLDPGCPHFHEPQAEPIRERAWALFGEMDELIGDLIGWAGSDGFILTMSDHGFGPLEKRVNVNLALREWGLLSAASMGIVTRSQGVRKLARKARQLLPTSFVGRASRAYVVWPRSSAFCAPVPQQGVYVNVRGREPYGAVEQPRYESVRNEIIDRFGELVDPDDGMPVVDSVHKREQVLHGEHTQHGPDVFPVCREYSYMLADGLHARAILQDLRDLPHGFHHMDGIFGVAGPGVVKKSGLHATVCDIAPTALYLAGLKVPEVDGRILEETLPPAMLAERPPKMERLELPTAGDGVVASAYTPEEEAQIEESLRNLGYL